MIAAPCTLDGTWVPLEARVGHQPIDVSELRVAQLVLDRGAYQIVDRTNHVVDRGDYLFDETKTPNTMDIVGVSGPNAGRSLLAIFELAGDRLTVCYDLDSGVRPSNMEPLDDQLLLAITYRRAPRRLS